MSTKTKKKPPAGQNGTPAAPAPVAIKPMRQWTLEERLEYDVAQADKEIARRISERQHLKPLIEGIGALLCELEKAGKVDQVKLEHFEPGEYGDEEVRYLERIQFSWNAVGHDRRWSNSPDFSITLMADTLPPSI